MSDDPLEPSAELILDWLEGRLPPAEAAAAVEQAVARPGLGGAAIRRLGRAVPPAGG